MPGDKQNFCPRTSDSGRTTLLQIVTSLTVAKLTETDPREVAKESEHDGSANPSCRDPPGQSSVYIPPGNHREESYRLATFQKWPSDAPVSVSDFAANGFYYTGYKDRVKCFSCGMSVDNWVIGDNVYDAKWHKSDCLMAKGMDESNVMSQLTNMKNGIRMLFNMTETQNKLPVPCGIQDNQAMYSTSEVHGSIRGAPSFLPAKHASTVLTQQQRMTQALQFPPLGFGDIHSEEHLRLLRSLDLANERDRRKTFNKWPSYPAPELPGKLAAEGFFYLGNLDRVQCFCCSGVLRNWARNDNPRTEHQRHFPNCSIILGTDMFNIAMSVNERRNMFEERRLRTSLQQVHPVAPPDPTQEEQAFLAQHFPCLSPVNTSMQSLQQRITSFDSSWPGHKLKATPMEIAKAGFYFLGQGDKTKCFYCNGGLQNWDEFDEPWKEHAKWFPGCEFVLRMKGVLFVRNLVEENPNLSRPTIRNPVSYDINYPHRFQAVETVATETTSRSTIPAANSSSSTQAKDTLQQLLTERICKRCYKETSDHLVQPCGHIALCSSCAPLERRCPICNGTVHSVLKVYRI